MYFELRPPTAKNKNTGYISVPMDAFQNNSITHFTYNGMINNIVVDVCMPKQMVFNACIYRGKHLSNMYGIMQSKLANTKFVLLAKEQILKFYQTGTMDNAKPYKKPQKSILERMSPIREYTDKELVEFHKYWEENEPINGFYEIYPDVIEKQYQEMLQRNANKKPRKSTSKKKSNKHKVEPHPFI